jgi:hypothetical protein
MAKDKMVEIKRLSTNLLGFYFNFFVLIWLIHDENLKFDIQELRQSLAKPTSNQQKKN